MTLEAELRGAARLLATHRQRLAAVAISAAILGGGYLARPERSTVAQIEERPAPLLQQVVAQRESQAFYRTLQDSAVRSAQYTVRVVAAARPPDSWSDWEPSSPDVVTTRFGVIVGARELMAEGSGLQPGDVVTATTGAGQLVTGRVAAILRERRLARIAVEVERPLPAPPPAARPRPGDAVVGVAPGAGGLIVAPLFVATATDDGLTTTTPLDRFAGAAIFNDARELVGIVARASGEWRVLPLEHAIVEPPVPAPPPQRFGVSLRVDPTADGDRILVAALAPDGLATRSGLRAADQLLTRAGEPVRSIPEARAVLQEAALDGTLRIVRGRRALRLRVPPVEAAP